MSSAVVWTDGSGPAGPDKQYGWAALIHAPGLDPVLQAGRGKGLQQANTVELLAVLEGLETLHWLGHDGAVLVHCDNQWVCRLAESGRLRNYHSGHRKSWARFDALRRRFAAVKVQHIRRVSTSEARIVDNESRRARRQSPDGKFR